MRTKYAVLFSGRSDYRHLNELELMYRVLITDCQFMPSNIYVLYFDGSINYYGLPKPVAQFPSENGAEPTDYQLIIDGCGTLATFKQALFKLKTLLQPEDLLFIHTSGHGGGADRNNPNIQSSLCDFSVFPSVKTQDLASALAQLPNFDSLVVMMSQCHGGGFISPILQSHTANQAHLSIAASMLKESRASYEFSPFAYRWIMAWKQKTIYSPQQAFEFALSDETQMDNPTSASFNNSNKPINMRD